RPERAFAAWDAGPQAGQIFEVVRRDGRDPGDSAHRATSTNATTAGCRVNHEGNGYAASFREYMASPTLSSHRSRRCSRARAIIRQLTISQARGWTRIRRSHFLWPAFSLRDDAR